ncbi:MAG: alpha-glucosidase C-terminal domain-containing protein [Prevotellaceae bacterium]|jgi:glycosidase|nr:alpha-glucosidase C-terminal domain-containing protein [Prevotellaceae bacterium]
MSKPIIYQAFVRHFAKKRGKNIPNGTIEENFCGKFNNFNAKALKSVRDLGATHIWLTGIIEHATQTVWEDMKLAPTADSSDIVKGIAGSPYAIRDYYDLDADLAENVENRMQEFENLVERAHRAGLKVIIDFVPNHLARTYHSDIKSELNFGVKDNQNVQFSPQNNFYYFPSQEFSPQFELKNYREFPAKATGNDCFSPSPSKNDWYETVKLNYGVDYQDNRREYFDPLPDTWLKMRDILLFWAEKRIDGFRCDMAEMVSVNFWNWAISKVKNCFPNIIFIAEIYNPAQYRNYLDFGKFDFLYDKVGLYDTLRGVICGYFPAKKITECWQNLNDIQEKMLNFLENHDEQRIASVFFAKNANAAKPALLVSVCLNASAAMIYAGQELGERGMDCEGFSGIDGRTTIFDYWQPDTLSRWIDSGNFTLKNLSQEEKSLRDFYRKVLNLCNSHKAISCGQMFDLMYENIENQHFNSEKCYAFLRKYENEVLLIAANFSAEKQTLKIKIPQHAFDFLKILQKENAEFWDLLSNNKFSTSFCENKFFEVEIEGFSGGIFEIK